jgi:pyruvate,water dikinase
MWDLGRQARATPEVASAFDAGVDGVLDALRASTAPASGAFLAAFERFLYEHGARGQNEYDLLAPSWEVRPRIALAAIDLMRRSDDALSPAARHDASVAERDRVLADVRARLAGDAETAGTFEAALQSAQVFLAGRERAKTTVVRVINEMRMALRELGHRLVERGVTTEVEQVFMVTGDELDRLRHEPDDYRAVIAARWAQFRSLYALEPVFVVNGRAPSIADMAPRRAVGAAAAVVGTVLRGSAGAGGVARGRARVVLDAADPVGLEPGDVLVAPQTDPSWVPLFVPAVAVVVNVGAMGSHAMIVSRELGIPCVASVADATATIPDGAIVTVDGNAGTVTIDEVPA